MTKRRACTSRLLLPDFERRKERKKGGEGERESKEAREGKARQGKARRSKASEQRAERSY